MAARSACSILFFFPRPKRGKGTLRLGTIPLADSAAPALTTSSIRAGTENPSRAGGDRQRRPLLLDYDVRVFGCVIWLRPRGCRPWFVKYERFRCCGRRGFSFGRDRGITPVTAERGVIAASIRGRRGSCFGWSTAPPPPPPPPPPTQPHGSLLPTNLGQARCAWRYLLSPGHVAYGRRDLLAMGPIAARHPFSAARLRPHAARAEDGNHTSA